MIQMSPWKARAAVLFALATLAAIGYYIVTNWRQGEQRSWFGL